MALILRNARPADTAACAALLARDQSRALRESGRNSRFVDPRACVELLDRLFSDRRSDVVVAERNGRLVGYLAGERQMFAPEEFASIYAEARSVVIPLHGHRVAEGEDPAEVYTELYGAVSGRWVERGMFTHTIGLAAEDREGIEAWSWLGFGHKSVCAIRETAEPVLVRGGPDVRVEQAGNEDDDLIEGFHRRLMTYQTGAPMFWPYNGEPDPAVREIRHKLLESGQAGCFLGWAGGEPAGMMLATPGIFVSPLLAGSDTSYLWEGFVDPEARASGVGALLLSRLMDWLRSRGQTRCALHFVAGNRLGRRFWLGNGFRPVELMLHRRIDDRVAWARGPA
jgi:GNAT superfamily N-acetyltransferase